MFFLDLHDENKHDIIINDIRIVIDRELRIRVIEFLKCKYSDIVPNCEKIALLKSLLKSFKFNNLVLSHIILVE